MRIGNQLQLHRWGDPPSGGSNPAVLAVRTPACRTCSNYLLKKTTCTTLQIREEGHAGVDAANERLWLAHYVGWLTMPIKNCREANQKPTTTNHSPLPSLAPSRVEPHALRRMAMASRRRSATCYTHQERAESPLCTETDDPAPWSLVRSPRHLQARARVVFHLDVPPEVDAFAVCTRRSKMPCVAEQIRV